MQRLVAQIHNCKGEPRNSSWSWSSCPVLCSWAVLALVQCPQHAAVFLGWGGVEPNFHGRWRMKVCRKMQLEPLWSNNNAEVGLQWLEGVFWVAQVDKSSSGEKRKELSVVHFHFLLLT